ncbi:hypothetical protein ACWOEC_01345 [Enterococcus bulliens]
MIVDSSEKVEGALGTIANDKKRKKLAEANKIRGKRFGCVVKNE